MQTAIHPFSQEEIMAYLDGELDSKRAIAAAQHLEQCRLCQQIVADFQSVSRLLNRWQVQTAETQLPKVELDRRPKERVPLWKRPWLIATVTALLLIAGAGLISKRSSETRSQYMAMRTGAALQEQGAQFDMAVPPNYAADRLASNLQARMALQTSQAQQSSAQPTAATGPMIVRTANLNLTAKEFGGVRSAVERLTNSYRGYVAQLQLNSPNGAAQTLNASLRVPAEQLGSFLSELKRLGRVDSESQSGEDVTMHVADVNARVSNLRTTEQRLTQLLRERTGKLSDVLEAEEALGRVRGEIETAEAEQRVLSNQVAMAAVQLTITEEYKASLQGNQNSTATRLRNAAVEGYRNVVDGTIGILEFFLSLGPVLLLWIAILFFPVRWAWRTLRAHY